MLTPKILWIAMEPTAVTLHENTAFDGGSEVMSETMTVCSLLAAQS